ncbi:hypothetical protein [Candidatus Pelagibacter sp. Uisw_127]|jgi:hypothetical protein|uniref:hypothetical protein n=1 Tax=Candidatus Pelagibacter sp. Uisw_127 TaxID=3230988 RepID=UPI0023B6C21E|nr:hypothetical protein [Candidatus Pelagibacter sp.]|tara:strand:+ start:109 stop:528 length:420 start_codon:yes stop_codon:yes gene_type:complete
MSFFTNKKPSVGLYILVWLLAFISSNVVVTLLDNFLSDAIIKSIDDFNNYVFIALPLEVVFGVTVVVFIYKKFPNLKMSKVMPWIYFFSAANIARTLVDTIEILEPLNVDLTIFTLGMILSFFGYVLGIRYFFVRSKQW